MQIDSHVSTYCKTENRSFIQASAAALSLLGYRCWPYSKWWRYSWVLWNCIHGAETYAQNPWPRPGSDSKLVSAWFLAEAWLTGSFQEFQIEPYHYSTWYQSMMVCPLSIWKTSFLCNILYLSFLKILSASRQHLPVGLYDSRNFPKDLELSDAQLWEDYHFECGAWLFGVSKSPRN